MKVQKLFGSFRTFTSRFKVIRMKNDEMFDDFYAQLNDIVNFSFNLSEKIPEKKKKKIKFDRECRTQYLYDP